MSQTHFVTPSFTGRLAILVKLRSRIAIPTDFINNILGLVPATALHFLGGSQQWSTKRNIW